MLHQPQHPAELKRLIQDLREASPKLLELESSAMLDILQRLAERWQPGMKLFARAEKLLEGTFSRRAVNAALTNLSLSLNPQLLQPELTREFGRSDLLHRWERDSRGTGLVRGFPLGVVAQILAGNVFLNGIIGAAQCLLTRNAGLLRISQRDAGLTQMFVESLYETDDSGVIQRGLKLCSWHRDQEDLNQVVREDCDAVVVWGGASAIAAYAAEQCRGRVIHYGPRLGIGVVLDEPGSFQHLPHVAWDIALWEQQACSSPRILLVQDHNGSGEHSRQVASALSDALSQVAEVLQPRELSLDEKAEILALREMAWWKDGAELAADENSMGHSVLVTRQLPSQIPVGYRAVMVVPFRSLDDLPAMLSSYRTVLQTVVLAASDSAWPVAVERLVAAGFTQVAAAGSAAARFLGLPHEADFSLRRLIKLVSIDLGGGPLCSPNRDPQQIPSISSALNPRDR